MTRKDYILIAAALRQAIELCADPISRAAAGFAAGKVCNALEQDNPRFDRERFLKACGVLS